MSTPVIDFNKVSLMLGGEVHTALAAGRVLFSPVESPDGLRALFVIGTDVEDLKAEADSVLSLDADMYLVHITPEQLTASERWDYLGGAPVLNLDGEAVAAVRVRAGNVCQLPTEHGPVEAEVVLTYRLRRGDLFILGDARLPLKEEYEVFRVLDVDARGMVVHSLTARRSGECPERSVPR
jgi:hypothetical protein